ncbi:unnamed protein product [Rodentolepis nana]|uniref:DUF4203 domain-containing protein n=1 Tax=Rodentolepis nana TaxID=102285 RepID=A0A0R3T2C4_RODNA|nr:unnamed protein product [Rodentolepis nana]
MNKNVGYGLLAGLVLLLLILSLGIPRWGCAGHILGSTCIRISAYKIVGILLAGATVAALLVAIFLLLVFLQGSNRMFIVALIAAAITALLAIAAIFDYGGSIHFWSPIIAAVGAGIALGLFVALLFDYNS